MTSDPAGPLLPIDDLLAELQGRLDEVIRTRDRLHTLLNTVVAIGSDLDLSATLRRIIEGAMTLVNARYGALGVLGEDRRLVEFIPVGLTAEEIAKIDHWPEGRGLLGTLITNPEPLRVADIAEDPRSAGLPPGHPPMRSFIGAPVRVRDEVFGNLYLAEKQGAAQFDEQDEAVLVALAAAAGVAVENARLYDEAHRQQRWLRSTGQVTARLLSRVPTREVLAWVTQDALEICDAHLVLLALPVGENRLVIEHAAGKRADRALGLVLPAGNSASGVVLSSGKPMLIDDFSTDPRVAAVARENLGLGPAALVPVGASGNVSGVLTAGRAVGSPPLAPSAVEMLASFAAQVGIVLELAEHRGEAERVILLEERDRIARDLHDLVIQRIYATGMSLEGTAALLGDSEAGRRVSKAVEALDETIREIRTSIFGLHTHAEEAPPSMRARILDVAEQMSGPLGFAPTLRLAGGLDEEIPVDVGAHLLTALREALSNVARHAKASSADVVVDVGSSLLLEVTDNGVGMPSKPGHRSGLDNLAERAEALGGAMDVGPAEGGGTTLRWQVPLLERAP